MFPSYLFVAIFLKKSFLTQLFNTWWRTFCLIRIEFCLILVYISLFQLPMKYPKLPMDINLSLEVRDVFVDISKAFARIWHEELIYKIKCMRSSNSDWIAFIRKTTKNCYEWKKIWMADNQSWCSSGFNFIYIYIHIYIETHTHVYTYIS